MVLALGLSQIVALHGIYMQLQSDIQNIGLDSDFMGLDAGAAAESEEAQADDGSLKLKVGSTATLVVPDLFR